MQGNRYNIELFYSIHSFQNISGIIVSTTYITPTFTRPYGADHCIDAFQILIFRVIVRRIPDVNTKDS